VPFIRAADNPVLRVDCVITSPLPFLPFRHPARLTFLLIILSLNVPRPSTFSPSPTHRAYRRILVLPQGLPAAVVSHHLLSLSLLGAAQARLRETCLTSNPHSLHRLLRLCSSARCQLSLSPPFPPPICSSPWPGSAKHTLDRCRVCALMRRRPSGSTIEEEDESSKSDVSTSSHSADTTDSSTHNLEPILSRSDSKAQRKRGEKPAWHQDSSSKLAASEKEVIELRNSVKAIRRDSKMDSHNVSRPRVRLRNPWSFSSLTLLMLTAAVALMIAVWRSFTTRQLDPKGGSMSYMASAFVRFPEFDTEHTPFATKYNLYLYREMGLDEDPRVR